MDLEIQGKWGGRLWGSVALPNTYIWNIQKDVRFGNRHNIKQVNVNSRLIRPSSNCIRDNCFGSHSKYLQEEVASQPQRDDSIEETKTVSRPLSSYDIKIVAPRSLAGLKRIDTCPPSLCLLCEAAIVRSVGLTCTLQSARRIKLIGNEHLFGHLYASTVSQRLASSLNCGVSQERETCHP
jgi:hypothetical protein